MHRLIERRVEISTVNKPGDLDNTCSLLHHIDVKVNGLLPLFLCRFRDKKTIEFQPLDTTRRFRVFSWNAFSISKFSEPVEKWKKIWCHWPTFHSRLRHAAESWIVNFADVNDKFTCVQKPLCCQRIAADNKSLLNIFALSVTQC